MVSKDEARRELARRELARRRGAPAGQEGGVLSTIGDVAASAPSALARGTMDLVGLPGTIGDSLNSGGQWALRKGYQLATGEQPSTEGGAVERFFAGPSEGVLAAMPNEGRNMLSGSVLKEGLAEKTFGASDYQPKTTPGEYTRTVGEFIPGAVAFGGANVPNLLRNAVAPALTSETAGQLTEGTAWEPYARIAGALLGGYTANKVAQPKAAQLPTARELKDSAGYKQLNEPMKAARLNKGTYQQIVRDIWDDANDFGLTTKLKQQFGGTLRDHLTRTNTAGGASLHDLELLRRSLRNAAGDKLDDAAQALSSRLIDKLDEAVEGLSASSIATAGEAGTPIVDVLSKARETYRVGIKSQKIEQAVEAAKNAASGFENGLRSEFRKLLKPNVVKTFSAAERTAIESVVRGTAKSNALRWLGGFGVPLDNGRNFLGSVMGGGVGAGVGSVIGGPVGAAVGGPLLVGVGTAAKAGANAATRTQAQIAEALVKAGPAASRIFSEALGASKSASREAITRALLQGIQAGGQTQASPVPLR